MTAPDQQEMTRDDLALDEAYPIRDALRSAFSVPDGVRVRLHRGGRPAWFLEMAWDGTETVGCGDRFFGEPGQDGFSLVASLNGRPVGYLSAELIPDPDGGGTAHVEMVQVDADHRGERIGSALAAGLTEILLRETDRRLAAGLEPEPWSVTADTVSEPAGRLIGRLERVLEAELDDRFRRFEEEGPEP